MGDRRIVVGVQHGRVRDERLGVAGAQHVERKRAVLGVVHVPVGHLFPRGARHARVGVRKEAPPADQLDRRQGAFVHLQPLEPRPAVG